MDNKVQIRFVGGPWHNRVVLLNQLHPVFNVLDEPACLYNMDVLDKLCDVFTYSAYRLVKMKCWNVIWLEYHLNAGSEALVISSHSGESGTTAEPIRCGFEIDQAVVDSELLQRSFVGVPIRKLVANALASKLGDMLNDKVAGWLTDKTEET